MTILKILIIGGGISGLVSAYYLDREDHEITILEASDHLGGLCSSFKDHGFTFDRATHVLHSLSTEDAALLSSGLNVDFISHDRKATVRIRDAEIPYPFQANYDLLPYADIVQRCRVEPNETTLGEEPSNFEEWCKQNYSPGICEYFMYPYNSKLWTFPLNELLSTWTDRFVPSEKSDLAGLSDQGYNRTFLYPSKGGICSIVQALESKLQNVRVLKSNGVKRINLGNMKAITDSGLSVSFDRIISTIALPELLKLIEDAPLRIRRLGPKLRWVSVMTLNLGVEGEGPITHWTYFPERRYPFYRIGYPSNLSSNMAPDDCFSITVEVSYSRSRPLPRGMLQRIIRSLGKLGIVKEEFKTRTMSVDTIKYAYVFLDRQTREAIPMLNEYTTKRKVYLLGRYGRWEYSSISDSLREARGLCQTMSL